MEEPNWLSPHQAGLKLGVTAERIRQLERAGRLSCLRTPLGRLFNSEDVDRLAAERERRRAVRRAKGAAG
jgi:predicted site-specific integrase-resolvase